ncbi:nuclear move domain-containing protein [Cryptosporidium ubiquitum]|uniref:Nuclear move domain-containing protein n=1 Tax=Cryptosporidium ubiquitum TaxID=857276 RepID=A0A1J4MGJ4_9CRYT|nr:nuclear move domain-containing protein [Cryptosporidium ubiquitum]OII73345.1 nuclear move domain-containing protein [Cryptosporidium ubiquitum]
MSGIDYSKWDKIEISSDEESGKLGSKCNVTRFDSPQSITIGGQRESKEDSLVSSNILVDDLKTKSVLVSREKVISLDDYVFGGKSACGKDYYWTQTENGLTIILEIDPGTQNKDLKVNVTEDKVTVTHGSETILFEEFEYGVKDDDNTIFWSVKEVESLNGAQNKRSRMLVLELEKKELDTSIRLWWKKIFKGGIEADISKFSRFSSPKSEERNRKFLEAWEEAHNEFRNKIKNRQKLSI